MNSAPEPAVVTPPDLRGVLSVWFSRAKKWWGVSLAAQVVASIVGALSVLTDQASQIVALGVGITAVLGAGGIWRSESLRQRAEFLLRHIELEDGFGWNVDEKILADSLASAIADTKKVTSRRREQGDFYSSNQPQSPRRVVENLQESAWFTQQLTRRMGWIATCAAILVGLITLLSLLVAASIIGATPLLVSNVVTAVISLLFAGNVLRLPFDYFSLSRGASEFDDRAKSLARREAVTERDALRLLSDYQLSRALAPLVPDWIWRLRRAQLSQIWSVHRQQELAKLEAHSTEAATPITLSDHQKEALRGFEWVI